MTSKRSSKRLAAVPRFGYPRPQLVRKDFYSLDGTWDFAIDVDGRARLPKQIRFKQRIQVPFAPETPASDIAQTGFFDACWYRRPFDAPRLARNQRLILHFGAVDYIATVWINDQLAGQHEGGYTPFCMDITDLLRPGRRQSLVVRAEDDPHDMHKPRGKQDWQAEPHSIWYFRTSGIWQTVWMERVNSTRIDRIHWTSCVEKWQISLDATVVGPQAGASTLRIRLIAHDRVLVEDTCQVIDGRVSRIIALPDPGIEDARSALLWSPSSPNLIDAQLELLDSSGRAIDSVTSYAAMRSIRAANGRIELNGTPILLQLVLDQGYWPQSGLTAPDEDAYRRDVELAKSMGFNGVRKHQKVESPRYLYWADRLGLMVWEEMPSAYSFSERSISRLARQWSEAIERDRSHPCIIAWVGFNESWGLPDLPSSAAQRHAQLALYHLTKLLDPTRPVIGNDGWEVLATDIVSIHDYDADPRSIERRYDAADSSIEQILRTQRPAPKAIVLDGFMFANQPVVLSEFGGIAFSKDPQGTWGYSRARTSEDLAVRYAQLLEAVRGIPMLAGFCYTQFADTYQEANGLLCMDRTPKFPLGEIACATRGPRTAKDHEIRQRWRKRALEAPKT